MTYTCKYCFTENPSGPVCFHQGCMNPKRFIYQAPTLEQATKAAETLTRRLRTFGDFADVHGEGWVREQMPDGCTINEEAIPCMAKRSVAVLLDVWRGANRDRIAHEALHDACEAIRQKMAAARISLGLHRQAAYDLLARAMGLPAAEITGLERP